MKKRPSIAVTPSYTKEGYIRMNPAYLSSLWRAGALPAFVSYSEDPGRLDEYASCFDGFLFAGGGDVDPRYYGEEVMFDSVDITPARDAFELALFERVTVGGKPVLGICRGIQLINVALGGSLHQHIEGHSQSAPTGVPTQRISLEAGTPLARILGGKSESVVNSFHHQAVKSLAPGLIGAARSDDGICEAFFLPGHPFCIGVQWHPELLEGEDSDALFRAFAESCR